MAMGRLNRPSIMVYGGTIKVRSKLVLVVCLGRIHFCQLHDCNAIHCNLKMMSASTSALAC